MPKSSRHKSHKQSKHSSKDLLSDSEEDVKVKERINTREVVAASVRVSIDSSHEKRRISSSFQSKEVKDLSYSEEHVSSKVRKDKVERITGSGDRWKSGGDEENGSKEMEVQKLKLDSEKGLKLRESKGSSDAKSKSSRRHESGVVEDRDVGSVLKGKEEENRSGSTRSDSKRKSDKDASRREGRESRDTKEKERVSDRESKKIVEKKQESEVRVDVGSVTKKRDSLSEDADKDRLVKRGKANSELGVLDKLRYPESEKELEKVIHRKIEGSNDRDRYRDARENDHTNVPSKGNTIKDGKHKDERYKAGNHRDNMEKDVDHRDDKYREHVSVDGDGRRRDDKHRDGGERERRREDRHRDDGDRDFKYRKDDEGIAQPRGDKYREGNERETKHREDKYRDGGKDNRHDTRYHEEGERVVGLKDEKHRVKNDRHKEEKFREDHEKDSELRDGRHGDKFDKEKRVREAKYKDDRSLRDRSGDKSAAINLRDDTFSSEILSRKPGIHDNSYDDRSQLKGAQGRKRTSDKDDYIDLKPRGFKDQRYDVEKRSASDARVEIATNRGRSGSRYADVEATSIRNRHSPSSGSHATRDQYRLSKQDDLKHNRENAYEERVGHIITSTGEHGDNAAGVIEKNSLSRSNGVIPKDDNVMGELSAERRMKSDTRNSPRHLISPSPTSADRRHYGRSDFRRSGDIEESVQRSSGCSQKEGRGTRDLGSETCIGDEPSIVDENAMPVSSPYPRNTNLASNSRSFSHPFNSPFRSADRHHNNRRNGDPNMVRVQGGSPWKGGIPNWPSPLANVFMPPFPHGPPPPPVGFHPSMHPFPGMRPSMGLNHHHPYPVPDNACHGGWRTPVYDPRPPPQLNGWEANDSAIGGGDTRFFGSQQHWHHGGPHSSKPVASVELPLGFEKDVHNLEGPSPPSQSSEQAKKDEQTTYRSDEYPDMSQTIDLVKEKVPVASEEVPVEETNDDSKMSEKNEEPLCHVYLSMLDISADLTDPELYSRYKDMVVNVDEKMLSDSEDDKILYVEVSKPKAGSTTEISSGSLFPTTGDSLLQKAMSLYRKQREGFVMKEKHSPTQAVDDDNKKEALHSSYPTEDLKLEIHPDSLENLQDVNKVNPCDEKSDEPVVVVTNNDSEISSEEEKLRGKNENPVSMETAEDFFPGRSAEEEILDVISSEEEKSRGKNENPVSMETEEEFPPGKRRAEEEILGVTENGSMNVLNVVVVSNKEAKEVVDDDVVMGELKSDESVKISRILHSPESTH